MNTSRKPNNTPGATGGLSASADGGDDEQEATILSGRFISPDRLRDHIGTQNVNDSVALVGKLPVAPGVVRDDNDLSRRTLTPAPGRAIRDAPDPATRRKMHR